MNDMMKKLNRIGIVPVVVLESAEDALPLAEQLAAGGLPCAEVTFRTAAAEESIRRMAKAFPDMIVGAGTVLTCEQADRAVDAGAKFIVSPGFNPKVTEHVLKKGVPMTPGVCTPTEIEAALQFDLDVLKFFPAEPSGGLKMIKALAAPYVGLHFMPTGGINAENVRDYLKYDRIVACGGSWMVSGRLVKEGNFAEIGRLVREAAGIVREIRG
ncbi:MAG: bifunctional 4-hydroxy-2-oxoglutarate aldolase/2-dehydro-3-deoxy-phosphogluconate aldolase [Clostridia bacterium]|nr:bifunctional 4-hydroxy-2-oxoglutarate aldolase/2-dehydro-3-deoxy-phosphogluconate aldolase [Clostridia bacterium]